jgi:hypothetical protein
MKSQAFFHRSTTTIIINFYYSFALIILEEKMNEKRDGLSGVREKILLLNLSPRDLQG